MRSRLQRRALIHTASAASAVALVSGTLVFGATTTAAPPDAPPAPVNDELSTADPSIDWQDCSDGFECGVLNTPVDYDEPDGETVGIALIRLPATDPDNRIGSLLFNPGGPGGSGVDIVRGGGKTNYRELNTRFDLIGFDPRGVGLSNNIVCLTPEQRELLAQIPEPTNDAEAFFQRLFRTATEQQLCDDNNPALLDHVSTANVARDMDEIRKAVGDEQLNYIGFSYGTYLGATYASLFPGQARALVLDGAVDPEEFANDPLEQWRTFAAEGGEVALDRFLASCESDPTCGFTGPDAASRYDDLIATLNSQPLEIVIDGQSLQLSGGDVLAITFQALYRRQNWPLLGQLLGELSVGETALVTQIVTALLADNSVSNARQAILAADEAWPRDVFAALAAGEELAQSAPRFAAFAPAALDFAFWPVDDEDAYRGPFTNPDDAAPVLVVGTTFDNATPYNDAIKLTDQLGNATLLTSDGDGHTAYSRSGPCIDDAVNAYLFDLTLPEEGTVCAQDPTFDPSAATPSTVNVETAGDIVDDRSQLATSMVVEQLLSTD
jgi:pimeloyl-ACP methyl ester carboxylesterase